MRLHGGALSAKIAKQTRSARGLPRRLAHAGRVALQILYWAATLQLRAGLRRRRDTRLIRRSGLFDVQFYLAQCPGDAAAREDPIQHYLAVGAARGLDPSLLFDTSEYVARNPAAQAAGENPLAHHLRSHGGSRRAVAAGVEANRALDPMLLGHPFRRARSPGAILVVRPRPPALSRAIARFSDDERALALLRFLRDEGYAVTLVSEEEPAAEDVEALERMGVSVRRGLDAAVAHLADEGHGYRAAILAGAELAWRSVAFVRAYAPQATVIYDRAERPPSDALLDELGAASADVVLVRTAQQREALLHRLPDARVEIVPGVAGPLAAGGAPDDPCAAIAKARLELAIGATRLVAADPEKLAEAEERPPVEVAERPGAPDAARSPANRRDRKVLAVGVYLCDVKNHAVEIARELGRAEEWSVEQQWIAVGSGDLPAPLAPLTAWQQRSRVPKFVLLNRLLAGRDLRQYEYVLVCDDDITLPERFVDRYLDLVVRYDLALAQPARTHASYTDNLIVERLDGLVARRTRFVEIGPLFSMRGDAVPLLTPFDESSPMGWGYDFVWPVLLERAGLRMGIVDATPVAHELRKPSTLYDDRDASRAMEAYLSTRSHLSPQDAFRIVEAFS